MMSLLLAAQLIAPGNLVVTALDPHTIRVSWSDTNKSEKGYSLERALSPNGPWVEIAITGKSVIAVHDTRLTPETKYFYRMRAWR